MALEFVAALVLVAAGIGVLALWLNTRQKLADERRKKRVLETEVARLSKDIESKDRASLTFVSNMAHELRSPLNSILGFSRLILREEAIASKNHRHLDIINRNGELLLSLINDILDFSKIESGRISLNISNFDLRRLMEDVGVLTIEKAHSKKLRFQQMIDDSVQHVLVSGDKGKLRQVILNLLTNAVKYTDSNHVTLGAWVVPIEQEQLLLHVDVEDSGGGIPKEKLTTIFEPFEQIWNHSNGQEGVGLGLAISKSFVELMGGTISVVNTLQGGSRFSIQIPLSPATEGVVEEKPRRGVSLQIKADQPKPHIMVVDDDPNSRDLMHELLSKVGFIVKQAGSGAMALKLAQEWKPDFVWMDLRMPDMDGFQTAERLRALDGNENLKIVALTAHAFAEHHTEVTSAGFDDLLLKPYHEEEMFGILTELLDVEFDYQVVEPISHSLNEIGADAFKSISPELIAEMRVAVNRCHNQRMHDLIDNLPVEEARLAGNLRRLVDSCEWGDLEDVLDKASKDS